MKNAPFTAFGLLSAIDATKDFKFPTIFSSGKPTFPSGACIVLP